MGYRKDLPDITNSYNRAKKNLSWIDNSSSNEPVEFKPLPEPDHVLLSALAKWAKDNNIHQYISGNTETSLKLTVKGSPLLLNNSTINYIVKEIDEILENFAQQEAKAKYEKYLAETTITEISDSMDVDDPSF